MLQIIIFSFNRALQLDTLLSSLTEHWKSPDYCIDVLYNSTGEDYEKAYRMVKDKFSSFPITYHRESAVADRPQLGMFLNCDNVKRYMKLACLRHPKSDFRSLLIKVIKENKSRYLMFLTDDAMFIRDIDIPKHIFSWLDEESGSRQFILRTGKGMNGYPEEIVKEESGFLKWNMYDADFKSNWGYNFSVDAHIYSKDVIARTIDRLWFVNPNTLEDPVCRALRAGNMMGEAMSYDSPGILSFPINMVQSVVKNETMGVDCHMLNEMFLNGYVMKYPVPETITQFQVYPDYLQMFRDNEELKISIR